MDTTSALDILRAFRTDAYACFRYRADALFDLMDALFGLVLITGNVCGKGSFVSH